MIIQLERCEPVPLSRLPELLEGDRLPSETLGVSVDLTAVVQVLAQIREEAGSHTASRGLSEWDARMALPLHAALAPVLTRRQATDPGLWHWLTIGTFLEEFVWLRWHGLVPADIREALGHAGVSQHFIGAGSLVGLARNGVARLFWTVETMVDGADDVDEALELARTILQNTDLFAAVFERKVGLHPPAARAAVRLLDGRPEKEHRGAMITLNRIATTIPLERLDEEAVTRLISRDLERTTA